MARYVEARQNEFAKTMIELDIVCELYQKSREEFHNKLIETIVELERARELHQKIREESEVIYRENVGLIEHISMLEMKVEEFIADYYTEKEKRIKAKTELARVQLIWRGPQRIINLVCRSRLMS